MSTNVTLKRKGASGNPVELYPKTVPAQVSGLITNGKISIGLLPDTVFGGMKLVGSFSTTTGASGPLALATFITGTTTTGYSISANLDTFTGLSHPGGGYTGIGQTYVGHYWVATNSVSINDAVLEGSFQPSVVFDDGVAPVSGNITVEAGDWLLISGWDNTNTQFTISIINNTYADAGTSAKGVVNLSNITTVTGSTTGNQVITQGVLGGLIGTAAGTIAAGDHAHSTLYQPLDADLTSLAGLASGNGFVIKTGTSAYSLDSNTYLNASTTSTQNGYFGDIHLYDDSTPSHYLKITAGSNLTQARTLTLNTGDSNRTITLAGDLTTSGAISFPTIASNQILIGNGAGTLGTINSTLIGRNTLTIPDITAISFARYNADETISMLDAATFRGAIGAGTSSTSGTVTSVAVDGSIILSSVASNGAITSTGTISHATAAGFKHIPSGGAEGQVLAYGDNSGVAQWEGRATGWTRVFYVDDATAAITNVTVTEGDIFIEF
jgi:hypothetical protein